MIHYPHLIKKFGRPINFFGDFLESFLKEKLKRPSKRVNGHTHCLQHIISLRSSEGRQYSLARKVLFPSDYVMSLLVKDESTDASISDESDVDDTDSTDLLIHKTSILMKPKKFNSRQKKMTVEFGTFPEELNNQKQNQNDQM